MANGDELLFNAHQGPIKLAEKIDKYNPKNHTSLP
jgi:hypothetical protein